MWAAFRKMKSFFPAGASTRSQSSRTSSSGVFMSFSPDEEANGHIQPWDRSQGRDEDRDRSRIEGAKVCRCEREPCVEGLAEVLPVEREREWDDVVEAVPLEDGTWRHVAGAPVVPGAEEEEQRASAATPTNA